MYKLCIINRDWNMESVLNKRVCERSSFITNESHLFQRISNWRRNQKGLKVQESILIRNCFKETFVRFIIFSRVLQVKEERVLQQKIEKAICLAYTAIHYTCCREILSSKLTLSIAERFLGSVGKTQGPFI